jgi:CheY-like chemotaxis protein
LKNILLIDDSEAEQFLYKSIIEAFDPSITVTSAYDGQEALDILDAGEIHFDAILVDINMPRLNGFEFLNIYQEKFKDEHVVVAMVTSSSQTSDKDKALSYGVVTKYFEKPLTADNLEELNTLVEQASAN